MSVVKLKRTTVAIMIDDRRQNVAGWIHPPYNAPRFAVTPVVLSYGTSPYYTVTHVPTGMRLGRSYFKETAFRAVRDLAALLDRPMWDKADLTEDEISKWKVEFPEEYEAARQVLGLPRQKEIDN